MGVEGIGSRKIVSIEELRAWRAARARDALQHAPGEGGPAPEDGGEAADAAPVDPGAERARLLEEFRRATEHLPEVRREKVIEARLRVSTGYYDREDVRRAILRAVLRDLLPRGAAPGNDEDPGAAERGTGDAPAALAPDPLHPSGAGAEHSSGPEPAGPSPLPSASKRNVTEEAPVRAKNARGSSRGRPASGRTTEPGP
jgi:hypothetical protein